jgi:hypothetical protein
MCYEDNLATDRYWSFIRSAKQGCERPIEDVKNRCLIDDDAMSGEIQLRITRISAANRSAHGDMFVSFETTQHADVASLPASRLRGQWK